jgi:hypothetical protein
MSRSFSANTDHLDAASAVRASRPVTVSAWVKFGDTGSGHIFNIGQAGTSNHRLTLQVAGAVIQSILRDASNSRSASASGSPSTGVWTLCTGTWTDDTTKACFRDGANKGTNAVAATPGTFDATRISGNLSTTPGIPLLSGTLVAHVGVWDIVLSDSEIAELTTKAPNLVRSDHLIEYWPLTGNQSPEPSSGSQATSLTVTGTSYSTDNPTITLDAGRRRGAASIIPIGLRHVRVY